MLRSARKSGYKARRSMSQDTTKSDFTLYDFAHSSAVQSLVVSGRLKKSEVNAFRAQVKEACGKSMLSEDSQIWFERDIADFELSDDESATVSCLSDVEETGIRNRNGRGIRCRSHATDRHDNGGVTYPLDIWFLIGKHIWPEDIASFSAICRESHFVVHSARFWSSLYRRFYSPAVDLPLAFRPSTLERVHGLKSRVVRALFYFYPSFQNRLRCMVPFENDPDSLEGTRCVRVWYQQIKQGWHFYFKFERLTPSSCPIFPSCRHSCCTDSLRAEADALYNPEEQNMVLQVVSPSYILLPEVVGQVLMKTSISVGHDMRAHKLKLVFNPTYVHLSKSVLTTGTPIIMDPVTNIHVLRWWHPKYPCRF